MNSYYARALLALSKPIFAPALAFDVALSFWGGFDVASGCVVDRSHPGHGIRLTGKILCLPSGRGSSSSSSVLAEAIRRQTAPAAIVLLEEDPVIVTGALVAQLLYDLVCPVVCLEQAPATIHDLACEHASLEPAGCPDGITAGNTPGNRIGRPAGDVIFRLNPSTA